MEHLELVGVSVFSKAPPPEDDGDGQQDSVAALLHSATHFLIKAMRL